MAINDALILRLPFPVSTNALYRYVPRRGPIASERYRKWRVVADAEIAIQNRPRRTFDGPVEIHVVLGAPNKIRRDGDNLLKALYDTCKRNGIIVDDDSRYVRKGSFEWGDVKGAIMTIQPFRE